MKNIFGGCFGAFRLVNNSYSHNHKTVTIVCPTAQDAQEQFEELARAYYPENQGWYNHYTSVAQVTKSQIEEYLESY